ncbi:MAG: hypothetical protein N3A69_08200 [Leptospiraceae bacterium]|nr:hypothetical protein [Leptospiraceae bacterium]
MFRKFWLLILLIITVLLASEAKRAAMSVVDLDKLEPEKITVGNLSEKDEEIDEREKFHESLKLLLRKSRRTGVIYKDRFGKIFTNGEYRFKLTPEVKPESFSHIEYKVGNGHFKIYEEPVSLEEEGFYKLSYRGVDLLGNYENTRSYNIRVDRTPPEIDLELVGDEFPGNDGNSYYAPNVKLEVRAHDRGAGLNMILININGQGNEPLTEQNSVFTKGGEDDIAVRALDNVYNLSKKVRIKFFIDTIKPKVNFSIKPEMKKINDKKYCKVDSTVTLFGKDEESGLSKIEYSHDGENWIEYTNPIIVHRGSPLKQGNLYSFQFRGIDNIGNISEPSVFECILDHQPPRTYIRIQER